jgi:hypothetical protein
MKKKKGQFVLYVGLSGEPGDPVTNEIINDALLANNLSREDEWKEYKGKSVKVWQVTEGFVKNLYIAKAKGTYSFDLLFTVYAEINYVFQKYRLREPGIRGSGQSQLKFPKKKK